MFSIDRKNNLEKKKKFATVIVTAKFSVFHSDDPFPLCTYYSLNDILKETLLLGTWLNDCFQFCSRVLVSHPHSTDVRMLHRRGLSQTHFTWVYARS